MRHEYAPGGGWRRISTAFSSRSHVHRLTMPRASTRAPRRPLRRPVSRGFGAAAVALGLSGPVVSLAQESASAADESTAISLMAARDAAMTRAPDVALARGPRHRARAGGCRGRAGQPDPDSLDRA